MENNVIDMVDVFANKAAKDHYNKLVKGIEPKHYENNVINWLPYITHKLLMERIEKWEADQDFS